MSVAAYGAPASFTVFPSDNPAYVGTADKFTITVTDIYGNVVGNYAGAVTLTSSDPDASFTSPVSNGSNTQNGLRLAFGVSYRRERPARWFRVLLEKPNGGDSMWDRRRLAFVPQIGSNAVYFHRPGARLALGARSKGRRAQAFCGPMV